MRNYIYILTFMISMKSFSQSKKEVVYLIFDKNNTEKCKINVEQTYENKKVKSFVKKYEKEKKNDKIIFNICDEKFIFNYENQKRDSCTIKSLNKFNIKNLDYLKNKYLKGKDFKHHTFEQINIIEIISNNQIVKYYNVYWSGEWTIE
jgi:hypothetical protein